MLTKHNLFFLVALLAMNQTVLNASKPRGGAGAVQRKELHVKLPQIGGGNAKTAETTIKEAAEKNSERPDEEPSASAAAKSSSATATATPMPATSPKELLVQAPQSTAAPITLAPNASASTPAAATVAAIAVIDAKATAEAKSNAEGKAATELECHRGPRGTTVRNTKNIFKNALATVTLGATPSVNAPVDLLNELSTIKANQKFSSGNDESDANFIATAAAETPDYATVAKTVPLLLQHATPRKLVNETARRSHRGNARKEKLRLITEANTKYETRINAAQKAYEEAMKEAQTEYSTLAEAAKNAHAIVLKTYDLGGDSDIDETEETYAKPESLAGVKPEQLRGVKQGELVVSNPLKKKKKTLLVESSSVPTSSSDASK